MKSLFTFIVLLAGGLTQVVMGQNKPPQPEKIKRETAHLDFVKEYVRELVAEEDLKIHGQKELSEAKTPGEQFSVGIYIFTSEQLELRNQIAMLKSMRLNAPFEELIPDLIAFYQHEIDLYQQLSEISKKMLEGPKPGVDYQALIGEMPQIRAELENIEEGVFQAAPMVFMTLIDQRPDSQNHLSHLVITKAEKADLQSELDMMLKDQPEHGDHDYYISAAMVLRGGLNKGHKCADESWE